MKAGYSCKDELVSEKREIATSSSRFSTNSRIPTRKLFLQMISYGKLSYEYLNSFVIPLARLRWASLVADYTYPLCYQNLETGSHWRLIVSGLLKRLSAAVTNIRADYVNHTVPKPEFEIAFLYSTVYIHPRLYHFILTHAPSQLWSLVIFFPTHPTQVEKQSHHFVPDPGSRSFSPA